MKKTIIVDYNMGNINSIRNMLRYIGYESELTSEPNKILYADKIILPGVGNFGKAMENIKSIGLKSVLDEAVIGKHIPILGICLGMQLLLSYSEEGNCDGLGYIPGQVKKFELDTTKYKVPHMGWDYVIPFNQSPLMKNAGVNSRFYFVHSYYVKCDNQENCVAKTNYGFEFDSIIQKDNIFGTQFHPEKSHRFGMELLRDFMEEC